MPPFVVLVPARYASTRLPGKPLADLGGRPMVVRVAERARASGASRVVVATDDARVAAACAAHGVEALITRADHPTGTDRLAEAAARLGLADDAIVVNVQGDEPLIDIGSVDEVVDVLQTTGVDMATLACALEPDELDARDVVKVVTALDGDALYFSRAPLAGAQRHIGLYGYQTPVLRRLASLPPSPLERAESLEQLRALQNGLKIRVVQTTKAHLGVDRPEDIARVEIELAKDR
jgi:3-deoxy-manno-octulosonate cytidylyltransferase (CMP-KDO synthetase)